MAEILLIWILLGAIGSQYFWSACIGGIVYRPDDSYESVIVVSILFESL